MSNFKQINIHMSESLIMAENVIPTFMNNGPCSWINIFANSGITFQSINQIWGSRLQFISS